MSGGIFSPDGRLALTLNKVSDLAILNVLWLLCSIPVITAGAATTALHYAAMKMKAGDQGYVIRNFFHSFKENFRQATIIWLLCILAAGILVIDFCIIFQRLPNQMQWVSVPACMAAAAFLFMFSYVFAGLAFFEASIWKTIKNAFFMSVLHLPYTLLILVVRAAPVWAILIFSEELVFVSFLDVVIMPAFCVWVNAKFFLKIFSQHLPEEVQSRQYNE